MMPSLASLPTTPVTPNRSGDSTGAAVAGTGADFATLVSAAAKQDGKQDDKGAGTLRDGVQASPTAEAAANAKPTPFAVLMAALGHDGSAGPSGSPEPAAPDGSVPTPDTTAGTLGLLALASVAVTATLPARPAAATNDGDEKSGLPAAADTAAALSPPLTSGMAAQAQVGLAVGNAVSTGTSALPAGVKAASATGPSSRPATSTTLPAPAPRVEASQAEVATLPAPSQAAAGVPETLAGTTAPIAVSTASAKPAADATKPADASPRSPAEGVGTATPGASATLQASGDSPERGGSGDRQPGGREAATPLASLTAEAVQPRSDAPATPTAQLLQSLATLGVATQTKSADSLAAGQPDAGADGTPGAGTAGTATAPDPARTAKVMPGSVTIALHPEALGRVTVTVTLRGGDLDVRIAADRADTQALLLRDRHQIEAAVAPVGGRLDFAQAGTRDGGSTPGSQADGSASAAADEPGGRGEGAPNRRAPPSSNSWDQHGTASAASATTPDRRDGSLYL